MSDYENMTVAELKQLLKKENLNFKETKKKIEIRAED